MASNNFTQSFRNFYNNMPYTGQGGMEWIVKRGMFTTPMTIKMIPVRDMSLPPAKSEFTDFDALVLNIRQNLPMGTKVQAIKVVENTAVNGSVCDIKIDYEKQRIRIFVRNEDNNDIFEVYPESIHRNDAVRESKSYVMSLSEFTKGI